MEKDSENKDKKGVFEKGKRLYIIIVYMNY